MQRYKIIATIYMFVVIFLTIFYCYDVIFPATFRGSAAFFQTKKHLFNALFPTIFRDVQYSVSLSAAMGSGVSSSMV